MSAIGPGSMLVCITDALSMYGIQHNRTYECEAAHEADWLCDMCGRNEPAVTLKGIRFPTYHGHELGACVCAFRPAGRKGDFAELLKVEPVAEGVEA